MLGAVFALASAAALGLNTAVIRRGVKWASPYYIIIVSLSAAVPVFAVISWATGQFARIGELGAPGLLLLVLAGLLNFIGGRYSNFRAIAAIGANLASPLRTFSTLFSAIFGFAILHEQVTTLRLIGLALIIAAPLLAFSQPSKMREELKSGTRLRLAEGFTFSFVAALSYASANFLIGKVVGGTDLGMLGATIAHASAATVMLATLAIPRNRRGLATLSTNSGYVFLAVSATMISAQIFRFTAFEHGDVAVVSALIETLAFFGLGFAFLVNREHELFTRRVVAGVALAALGAIALTV